MDDGKSCILSRLPLHGSSAAVTSQTTTGNVAFKWIAHLLRREENLLHSNLIAIVYGGSTPQRQQQHCGNRGLGMANTRQDTWAIVISKDPVRPSTNR